jgi:radical SAM protein with 4Fe4S-binding SPASM domain
MYHRLLNEVAPKILGIQFYFQGEPLLHPAINELIAAASQKGLYTMLSTNAQLLPEKANELVEAQLSKIVISMDGTTQSTYAKYRVGGSLEKVTQGIDNLILAKKNHKSKYPQIELQFIAFAHNLHQIADFKAFCKEKGVIGKIKTAQVENPESENAIIPIHNKLSRYRKISSGKWQAKHQPSKLCKRLYINPVICWDGQVLPCCYDKNGDFAFGNISTQRFTDIWQGKEAENFRAQHLQGKFKPMCFNCIG